MGFRLSSTGLRLSFLCIGAFCADAMASDNDWERGRVKAAAAKRARDSASLDAEHSQSTC
jgi:hypothetical protein